jgi:hypothetical protein
MLENGESGILQCKCLVEQARAEVGHPRLGHLSIAMYAYPSGAKY